MMVTARDEWFPIGRAGATDLFRKVVPPLREAVKGYKDPSVTQIAKRSRSPFKVLVSTVISARTKDEVTGAASERLFALAGTPEKMSRLRIPSIEKAIYPAGFYKTKAKAIKNLCLMLLDEYDGKVPDGIEDLLRLPGVGRKTANLVLTLGFEKPGICVDTHVHRVCNRLGAVKTKDPTETEFALREVLPKKNWIEINDLLVMYGQAVCNPVSPWCSRCGIIKRCGRVGVARSR
jgi:endonuclease-3